MLLSRYYAEHEKCEVCFCVRTGELLEFQGWWKVEVFAEIWQLSKKDGPQLKIFEVPASIFNVPLRNTMYIHFTGRPTPLMRIILLDLSTLCLCRIFFRHGSQM